MAITDFHIHTSHDPSDRYITATPKQLIDAYYLQGISVIAFTHHHKLICKSEWKQYAKSKGILLMPGVEKNIQGADVLIINAKTDNIDSFGQLYTYKQQHPESLIIAPHPFAPGIRSAIGQSLYKYAHCFDAIELNAAVPFARYANKRAQRAAKTLGLPTIANSDTHHIKQVGSARTHIAGTTWPQILQSIKKQRVLHHIKLSTIKKYGVLYPQLAIRKYFIPHPIHHVE